ncbi:MAG: alpha-amylase [Candidatus Cloacimonetes bacterium]|nr:alpha-amylase [Candidatus Cloacimonadota bacterium]
MPEAKRYPGLHVTQAARRRYRLRQDMLSSQGKAVFEHFQIARLFARQINIQRQVSLYPERAVRAGHLHGAGLIDRILFLVMDLYAERHDGDTLAACRDNLREALGEDTLRDLLETYIGEFPPQEVDSGEQTPAAWLEAGGDDRQSLIVRELLRFWLTDSNEAFAGFDDMFRSDAVRRQPAFVTAMSAIDDFFAAQPGFGPDNKPLVQMLREPAEAEPHSIPGQLDYIRRRWGSLLEEWFYVLLRGMDFIAEEDKVHFDGKGESQVLQFARRHAEDEPERFSPDRDWMPRLLLIAKSTYVWLDQLSRRYQRTITRLDQIPDEELDRLRDWGFTGLWLIGVWERSLASRRLKQMLGRDDAIASAYSLHDYTIAEDLGGEAALADLRHRAWQRGIRMGSDMVPNHMGIDSRWVIEHPEWFVQSSQPPFPAYTYNSANLSEQPGVGLWVEDHYYDRTDAAVTFKRADDHGERYIYHGNDGTNMPWNDTAQLNYLLPEVRQAVLDRIVAIAQQFPIIRFDAAMTLTKKHFQRLWFPEPGSGGDIPSRAECGLSREQFDAAMPEEFWRQVVDKVAEVAPDTLLLAEAFWLMEGYFVRTLGMHRVYNSAFMNMLKSEENEKYRQTIRNVLEFNPEILKRLVNFMNNPDEETAIAQFGQDDKYFGVCTLMVTLPGLPMFGHGQIEGLKERYGMEYSRAMWDEQPDQWLVRRHEREIFPLMKLRHVFAEVKNFALYDFIDAHGQVNQNVFAHTNRCGDERALVIYNNRFDEAAGWVKNTTARRGDGFNPGSVGEGLGLRRGDDRFVIFRDHVVGLQYIRRADSLHHEGLFVELGAFKYHVFIEFEEVADDSAQRWAHLERYLTGRGVPDMRMAMKETFLQPLQEAFGAVFEATRLQELAAAGESAMPELLESLAPMYSSLLARLVEMTGHSENAEKVWSRVHRELQLLASRKRISSIYSSLHEYAPVKCNFEQSFDRLVLVGWALVHRLGEVEGDKWAAERSRSYIDQWLLLQPMREQYRHLLDERAESAVELIASLTEHQQAMKSDSDWETPLRFVQHMLADEDVRQWLQVNRWRDVLWFNQERFEQMLGWVTAVLLLRCAAGCEGQSEEDEAVSRLGEWLQSLWKAMQHSGYQVEKLLSLLRDRGSAPDTPPNFL